jgi:hypothetical protein
MMEIAWATARPSLACGPEPQPTHMQHSRFTITCPRHHAQADSQPMTHRLPKGRNLHYLPSSGMLVISTRRRVQTPR